MKPTVFPILYTGLLIIIVVGALEKKEIKDEVIPPRPSLPLFMLPSFSLPSLNFPYLQGLSNRGSSADKIRATKTEYIEVTRRQTVHPMCYTAYEAKSPCLPFGQSDLQDDYDGLDFDTIHQTHENLHFNEVRNAIKPTPTSRISRTEVSDLAKESNSDERVGKYLEFKFRREPVETLSKIEGSETLPNSLFFPNNYRRSTEYFTKTVLITKLEKYTDRRVTATLLAVNCLPVDRSIPMCQSYPSPILEAPGYLFKEIKIHPTSNVGRNTTNIASDAFNTKKKIIMARQDVDEASLTMNLKEEPTFTSTHGNETRSDIEPSETDTADTQNNDAATEPVN